MALSHGRQEKENAKEAKAIALNGQEKVNAQEGKLAVSKGITPSGHQDRPPGSTSKNEHCDEDKDCDH